MEVADPDIQRIQITQRGSADLWLHRMSSMHDDVRIGSRPAYEHVCWAQAEPGKEMDVSHVMASEIFSVMKRGPCNVSKRRKKSPEENAIRHEHGSGSSIQPHDAHLHRYR